MLLRNYFDEKPQANCRLLSLGISFLIKMEKENLSNKDGKENQFLFYLQVESPIICPLLQKMDENGLFQEEDLWKIS